MFTDVFGAILYIICAGIFVTGLCFVCTLFIMKTVGGSPIPNRSGKREIPLRYFLGGCLLSLSIIITLVFAGQTMFGETGWWQRLRYFRELTKDIPGI